MDKKLEVLTISFSSGSSHFSFGLRDLGIWEVSTAHGFTLVVKTQSHTCCNYEKKKKQYFILRRELLFTTSKLSSQWQNNDSVADGEF